MFKNGKGPSIKFTDISKGSSSLVRQDDYARFYTFENMIVVDETFFKLWKDENKYKKDEILSGSFHVPAGLDFNSPADKRQYANTDQMLYRQFFKKTLFHEATHRQETRRSIIPFSELFIEFSAAIYGTSERGELFEFTMYGSISSHHDHGFATYQAFELAQRLGDERTVWRHDNTVKLRTKFVELYGSLLKP
jgi:hypothetical protein